MSMKYLVISDAHIGLCNEEHDNILISHIIELANEFDQIIFNGDMLETWKFENLEWSTKDRTTKLQRIFDKFPQLEDFMRSNNCKVIIGNHDLVLENHGFPTKLHIIKTAKGDVLITHGNDSNYSNSYEYVKSKKSWTNITGAWFLSKISTFLAKIGIGDIDKHETKWDEILFTAIGGSKKLNIYADKMLAKHVAYAIVTGHTHQAEEVKLPNGMHFNCGFSRYNEIQGVEICTNGEIKLFKRTYNQ